MALTIEWFKRKKILVAIVFLLLAAIGVGVYFYLNKPCPDKCANLGQNGDPATTFDQRRWLQARQDNTGMTQQYGDAALYQMAQTPNQPTPAQYQMTQAQMAQVPNQLTPAQYQLMQAQMAQYQMTHALATQPQTQMTPASAAQTAQTAQTQTQGASYQPTRAVGS